MAYTQDGRLISLKTPLGKDVLLLDSFTGTEGISQLLHFHLQLLSERSSITAKDIVGKQVTITVSLPNDKKHYINGFVSRFTQGGRSERLSHYEAEVVPWTWFLTHKANCRIFQNMTPPDIIEKIFHDAGFRDFKKVLSGSYDQREYCVQYRETDFNFVTRLAEQYGIFYFFEHEEGKHTLVLGDSPSAHKPCPEQEDFLFDAAGSTVGEKDVVTSWEQTEELRPGKFALNDYDFKKPSTSLLASVLSVVKVGGNDRLEVFDYPGEYETKSQGDSLAKIRMQEEEATYQVMTGAGSCRAFTSGYRFNLQLSPNDKGKPYILTEIHQSATSGAAYETGEAHGEGFSSHFTCIPHSVPYRPPRTTPKPIVQGPQTAVVVGPSGEEIYTDKYGRVKVKFHWDREDRKGEERSCWIRVAQPWAGKNWGAMWIPRIGQEVIVEFLEGDPDQPIITGRVYNAEQMPPYELPKHHTRSTFLSRSSKGGGSANFNEIRFEDKKGDEQIFINAEKDMDLRVEHDSREFVGNDRHLIVKANQQEKVEGDKHGHVKGNHQEKIDGDMSLQVGGSRDEKVGTKHALESGQEIHLKSGMKIIIESGLQISLKGAGGFVDIGPAGVTIQGTMVLINSGGSAGSGSGSSPKDPKDPDEADDGTKGGKK